MLHPPPSFLEKLEGPTTCSDAARRRMPTHAAPGSQNLREPQVLGSACFSSLSCGRSRQGRVRRSPSFGWVGTPMGSLDCGRPLAEQSPSCMTASVCCRWVGLSSPLSCCCFLDSDGAPFPWGATRQKKPWPQRLPPAYPAPMERGSPILNRL